MSGQKLYFCDELNNVLSCFHDRIMSCCSGQIGPVYYENYRGEKIDWEAFRKIKTDAFDMLTSENIEKSPCKDCFFLRERTSEDTIKECFTTLNISHWTHCNCGCIYCARMLHSKGKIETKVKKSEYYDMLPLLKQLYKQELLDRENLTAAIQGGDISVLKEFEPIVKECLKSGVKSFYILSNNIKYQPVIKKLLDLNKTTFTTSLDCASRDVFYKLKRVDKFNDSVNNLKKYAKSKYPENIVVKYILIEHINDNIEEVTKFVNLMSDIGIQKIEFMIDNKYAMFTDLDKTPLPEHYGRLYLTFKNLCRQKDIQLQLWSKTQHIIDTYALKN